MTALAGVMGAYRALREHPADHAAGVRLTECMSTLAAMLTERTGGAFHILNRGELVTRAGTGSHELWLMNRPPVTGPPGVTVALTGWSYRVMFGPWWTGRDWNGRFRAYLDAHQTEIRQRLNGFDVRLSRLDPTLGLDINAVTTTESAQLSPRLRFSDERDWRDWWETSFRPPAGERTRAADSTQGWVGVWYDLDVPKRALDLVLLAHAALTPDHRLAIDDETIARLEADPRLHFTPKSAARHRDARWYLTGKTAEQVLALIVGGGLARDLWVDGADRLRSGTPLDAGSWAPVARFLRQTPLIGTRIDADPAGRDLLRRLLQAARDVVDHRAAQIEAEAGLEILLRTAAGLCSVFDDWIDATRPGARGAPPLPRISAPSSSGPHDIAVSVARWIDELHAGPAPVAETKRLGPRGAAIAFPPLKRPCLFVRSGFDGRSLTLELAAEPIAGRGAARQPLARALLGLGPTGQERLSSLIAHGKLSIRCGRDGDRCSCPALVGASGSWLGHWLKGPDPRMAWALAVPDGGQPAGDWLAEPLRLFGSMTAAASSPPALGVARIDVPELETSHDVFVSTNGRASGGDALYDLSCGFADRLSAELAPQWSVWHMKDHQAGGRDFHRGMLTAVLAAPVFVALLTPAYWSAPGTVEEFVQASVGRRHIIPVLVDGYRLDAATRDAALAELDRTFGAKAHRVDATWSKAAGETLEQLWKRKVLFSELSSTATLTDAVAMSAEGVREHLRTLGAAPAE